jgi:hypothetical protein
VLERRGHVLGDGGHVEHIRERRGRGRGRRRHVVDGHVVDGRLVDGLVVEHIDLDDGCRVLVVDDDLVHELVVGVLDLEHLVLLGLRDHVPVG